MFQYFRDLLEVLRVISLTLQELRRDVKEMVNKEAVDIDKLVAQRLSEENVRKATETAERFYQKHRLSEHPEIVETNAVVPAIYQDPFGDFSDGV